MSDIDELLSKLIKEVGRIRNLDCVTAQSTLSEVGIDSLNVIELILACESLYPNVKNPELIRFDEFTTIEDIHQQLLELSA